MKRVPVTSTNVSEIGYDEERRILEIVFSSGGIYQYFEVPPQVYQELMNSGSIGQYLNSAIKGAYRYARV